MSSSAGPVGKMLRADVYWFQSLLTGTAVPQVFLTALRPAAQVEVASSIHSIVLQAHVALLNSAHLPVDIQTFLAVLVAVFLNLCSHYAVTRS